MADRRDDLRDAGIGRTTVYRYSAESAEDLSISPTTQRMKADGHTART
jgi:hypothetical protein